MTAFSIQDKEIESWLLSRDWIFYYAKTRPNSGWFYPIPADIIRNGDKDYLKRDSDGNPYNYYKESGVTKSVDLDLPHDMMATYACPSVMLKIWGDNLTSAGKYEFQVYFIINRAGDTEYEQVFHGWVSNLEEIKQVFRLLSVNEEFLK